MIRAALAGALLGAALVPFGGKAHQTVLEVIFGYKGRLYFRKTKDKRAEVLAVGTKNTQARELDFLARL